MKLLRAAGWTMIWAGVLIFAFLAYQLFGTSIGTNRAQVEADEQLETIFEASIEELAATGVTIPTDSINPTVVTPTLFPEPVPVEGQPFARLLIPAVELDRVVWEGVEREDLKNGPGHMPWTALPGQPGNSVISGHRTTYGAPFFRLDELVVGDSITIETATGSHVYEVREILIVDPTAIEVTEFREGAWLTLTTCHPVYSAAQRLVIHAELVDGPNFPFVQSQTTDSEASS
jgi:sortase A